jgi:hypothetical protein
MKHWLVFAGFALAGSLIGVMAATVIAAHTAAAQPAATTTTS